MTEGLPNHAFSEDQKGGIDITPIWWGVSMRKRKDSRSGNGGAEEVRFLLFWMQGNKDARGRSMNGSRSKGGSNLLRRATRGAICATFKTHAGDLHDPRSDPSGSSLNNAKDDSPPALLGHGPCRYEGI